MHHADDAHSPDDHDSADAHHEPALPEPETPLWLTLVGVLLFVSVGIFFLARNAP